MLIFQGIPSKNLFPQAFAKNGDDPFSGAEFFFGGGEGMHIIFQGVSKNCGVSPKMDGENNGKPY